MVGVGSDWVVGVFGYWQVVVGGKRWLRLGRGGVWVLAGGGRLKGLVQIGSGGCLGGGRWW